MVESSYQIGDHPNVSDRVTQECASPRGCSGAMTRAMFTAGLFALGACSGDEGPSACERYEDLAKVMSRVDPEYWSDSGHCPSDGEIASKGWPQSTLAECVAYLEERCENADVEACIAGKPVDQSCRCSVPLGAERVVCAPF